MFPQFSTSILVPSWPLSRPRFEGSSLGVMCYQNSLSLLSTVDLGKISMVRIQGREELRLSLARSYGSTAMVFGRRQEVNLCLEEDLGRLVDYTEA